jgi:hypothetical protein
VLVQALVLAAVAIAAIVLVALPLLRVPSSADELDVVTEEMRARLDAAERRDAALAALSELEFDHRTSAVSDEDYRVQVVELRRAVAAALKETAEPPRPDGAAPEADAARGYHRRA